MDWTVRGSMSISELTRKTRIEAAVKKVDVGTRKLETGFITSTYKLCGVTEATNRCAPEAQSIGTAATPLAFGKAYPGVGNNAIFGADYSARIIVRA